jgi:benzoyl-CoA reductase/2-hydroxyglutaryl-CoA dehydratase subunit BcrC/BadD/HgdB
MPAVSERQRRFMGAELGRLRAGQATETGMTEQQLRDFAKKPKRKRGALARRMRLRRKKRAA